MDIVIPVYGSPQFLPPLLAALQKTILPEDRVFLVDDCTPPEKGQKEVQAILANLPPHFSAHQTPQNSGFAAACNCGVRHGQDKFICLLNSDTIPLPNWRQNLVAPLADPMLGAVGAKLLFPADSHDPLRPAGRIQHAGVAFNAQRLPFHIFSGWPHDHPRVNRPLLLQAVTGACLLTRRKLYEQFPLDEIYGPGNFEDIDFCLQLGQAGYQIAYAPQAVLFHHASGSNNVATVTKNARIFLDRWADKITSDDWLLW